MTSQTKDLTDALAKGQTSLQSIPALLSFPVEITYDSVKYQFTAKSLGPNIYSLNINGQVVVARVREQPDSSLLCSIGNDNYQLFGQDEALGLRMKINGATVMIPTVYNPSELRSDVTGKVVRFLQQDGENVEKDQPYVEVEAMKMIMAIKSTESGVINHNLSPGSIISAGDLIASLQLKDPSRVKQISSFKETLSVVPPSPPKTTSPEDALEQINLALDGFEHEGVEASVPVLLATNQDDWQKTTAFFTAALNKFLAAEKLFVGQEESAAVSALIKANKDGLLKVVPSLIAHKQLKPRAALALSLLRQLEFLPERVSAYSADKIPADLKTALQEIAQLAGPAYGELSLKAKQIIDDSLTPPFQARLDALKKELMIPGADLNKVSKQPNLAVSVDLLAELLYDGDANVRKAAMEVYIRRVYRAHCVKEVKIVQNEGNTISAAWTFTLRTGVVDGTTPIRQGFMTMLPDFASVKTDMPKVMEMASKHLTKSTDLSLNVLHVGFQKYVGDEATTVAQGEACLKEHLAKLKSMDVRSVNFLLDNPGKKVSYLNFLAETSFKEDAASRNMRASMPQLFELNRLQLNHDLERLATVGRNSQLYLGREKLAAGKKGEAPQVLFLRSISLSPDSVTKDGAERVFQMALDELDRASLDSRVSATASSRVFLNILPEVQLSANQAVSQFEKTMDYLISKYATRLLKLNVDEIEVKVRVTNADEGKPAEFIPVRLIASSSTGGWLTREAYREYLDPVTGQTMQYCTLKGDQICILDPYPTSSVLQLKRTNARRVGSTYAPDFLGLMEVALINSWQAFSGMPPPGLFAFDELVMGKDGNLNKEKRFPGTNKVGERATVPNLSCKSLSCPLPLFLSYVVLSGRHVGVAHRDEDSPVPRGTRGGCHRQRRHRTVRVLRRGRGRLLLQGQ